MPSSAESSDDRNSSLAQLLDCLSVVPDPRKARGVRYTLTEILFTAIVGSLCGCDDAEALEDWGNKELAWLRNYLSFSRGAPKQDVYLRVLGALDPDQFRSAFLRWAEHLFNLLGFPSQIAIDGQTHRGSRTQFKKPVHMVHAYACELGLVMAQQATSEKSNEITAIPLLLDLLDLRGALVSMDAMGCQVKIANQIETQGGDWLLGLKGNQSNLHTEVIGVFEAAAQEKSKNIDDALPPELSTATQTNGGHGRIETQQRRSVPRLGGLDASRQALAWTHDAYCHQLTY